MRLDKKTRGSTLRLVVLDDLARPAILAEPDPELLRTAYREIAR
jgi:3-dehydroquinate synthase